MMAYWSMLIRRVKEEGDYYEEEMVYVEADEYFEAVTKMLEEHGQKTWLVQNLGVSTHMPTA